MNRFTKEQMEDVVKKCESHVPNGGCDKCGCNEKECAVYIIAELCAKHKIDYADIQDALWEHGYI